MAIATHYFLLSTFAWAFVLMVNLVALADTDNPTHLLTAGPPMILNAVVGYILPAIAVGVTVAFGWQDYGTRYYCWFAPDSWPLYTFVASVLGLSLVRLDSLRKCELSYARR